MNWLSTIMILDKPEWTDWVGLGLFVLTGVSVWISFRTMLFLAQSNKQMTASYITQIEAMDEQKTHALAQKKATIIALISARIDIINAYCIEDNLANYLVQQINSINKPGHNTNSYLEASTTGLYSYAILLQHYGHLAALCNSVCDPYQNAIAQMTYKRLHRSDLTMLRKTIEAQLQDGLEFNFGKYFIDQLADMEYELNINEEGIVNIDVNRLI